MHFFRNILGILLMVLVISTEVKGECTRPTTNENAGIHPDDITKVTFEEQSTIRLKCDPGYEPDSSVRRLTCENGQWTPSPTRFICKKKSCSSPGDVSNGRYIYSDSISFGAVIKAECNQGFYMIGLDTRTCMADGEWSGNEAVCEAVKCGSPPTITNGRTQFPPEDDYHAGHAVQYECNTGYDLFGDNNVVCKSNGTRSEGSWSSPLPRCKNVECPRPNITNATRVQGGSGPYRYRVTLEYKCNDGFMMTTESGRMVCEENGWSNTPKCKEVECPNVDPTNATITRGAVGPYNSKAVIEYKCPAGQELVGRDRLTCGSDGRWSSNPPICLKVVECPEPGSTNASISEGTSGPYRKGAIIKYKCQIGYRLEGSLRLECGSDGQWSSTPPICQEVECPKVNPTNATITRGAVGPYNHQAVIEYKCPAGQHLDGRDQLTCGSDGRWSSNPPVCLKGVTCSEPQATNATIIEGAGGSYKTGDIIKYKCPAKQKLVGSDELRCETHGQWSVKPPVCKDQEGGNTILIVFVICYCKKKRKSYTGPQSAAEGQDLKGTDQENGL